jgi:hypothetical protein
MTLTLLIPRWRHKHKSGHIRTPSERGALTDCRAQRWRDNSRTEQKVSEQRELTICRSQRDKLGHGNKEGEQGTLTFCRTQRETSGYKNIGNKQGALTSCRAREGQVRTRHARERTTRTYKLWCSGRVSQATQLKQASEGHPLSIERTGRGMSGHDTKAG